MAKCRNGGSCVNGKCVCTKNFSGELCEKDLTASSNLGWIILLILVILVAGVGIYLVLNKSNEGGWGMNKNEDTKIDKEFKENNKNEDLIR